MRTTFIILIVFWMSSATRAQDHLVQLQNLLGKYCIDCHNSDSQEADVDLSKVADEKTLLRDHRIWRRAIEMVEAGAMPPGGNQQPTRGERKALAKHIKHLLEHSDWYAVRAPGRVPLTRMTREAFGFAVEDLFGVRLPIDRLLPADPEGLSGFANDHTSLVMTPKQLTRYLKAAEIVAEAVVDQSLGAPHSIDYEVERGTNANWKKPHSVDKDGTSGWTFSSRLGNKYQAVNKTFDFTRTGLYRLRMRARSKGPGNNAAAWIAIDSVNDASRETGILVNSKEFEVYETELFITKGRHTILLGYDFYGPLWLPDSPDRAQIKLGQSTFDPPPYDRSGLIPSGVKMADMRDKGIKIPDNQADQVAELVRTINEGYFVAVLDNLMLHKFHYERGYLPVFLGGLGYDYQVTVLPAFKKLAAITKTDQSRLEGIWESHQPPAYENLKRFARMQREAWNKQDKSRKRQVGDLFVDWIKIEAISQRNNVPAAASQLESYLDQILPLAFRRPINSADRDRFSKLYKKQRASGAGHQVALQRMLIALMVSPEFLYRTDGDDSTQGVARLKNHALAARLSSFVWSSLPDRELLRTATDKTLFSNDQIDQQVDRMLDDPRRKRFSALFTEQWLNLSDIGRGKEPDKELFRYFSWRLAEDMREEVALMFDRIIRENRSVLELLDDDHTFLNERLARLYAIDNVLGPEFRSVKLTNRQRGGLLGTAAVLTSTSLASRTSPVRRGQFVLETLLGVDLPSPPADVPQFDERVGQTRTLSVRESLSLHRQDARCAGCHRKIDPWGFALENFDWIGRWRENDAAGPVDSKVELTGEDDQVDMTLSSVKDLKAYLMTRRSDDFVAALTKAMVKYSLGRDVEYYDESALRKIVAEVKADGYRSRTMIKAIARSFPFRYREIKETGQ